MMKNKLGTLQHMKVKKAQARINADHIVQYEPEAAEHQVAPDSKSSGMQLLRGTCCLFITFARFWLRGIARLR